MFNNTLLATASDITISRDTTIQPTVHTAEFYTCVTFGYQVVRVRNNDNDETGNYCAKVEHLKPRVDILSRGLIRILIIHAIKVEHCNKACLMCTPSAIVTKSIDTMVNKLYSDTANTMTRDLMAYFTNKELMSLHAFLVRYQTDESDVL